MSISDIANRFSFESVFTKTQVDEKLLELATKLEATNDQRILRIAQSIMGEISTDEFFRLRKPQDGTTTALTDAIIRVFPSGMRAKLSEQKPLERKTLDPLIASLYNLGSGLLPSKVFAKITDIAAGLPELAEGALKYINDGNPTALKKLDRLDALRGVLIKPSIETLGKLSTVGEFESSSGIADLIKEQLYEEVNNLRSLILNFGIDQLAGALKATTSKDPVVDQAVERANVLLPSLIEIFQQDVERQGSLVESLRSELKKPTLSNSDSTKTDAFDIELMKLESLKDLCLELEQFLGALKAIKAFPNNTAKALNS